MLRCPFCHHRAKSSRQVVCRECGARLTSLDRHRPWRQFRRVLRLVKGNAA